MAASGWKEKGFEANPQGLAKTVGDQVGGAWDAPKRRVKPYYGASCIVMAPAASEGIANPTAAPIVRASKQAKMNLFDMFHAPRSIAALYRTWNVAKTFRDKGNSVVRNHALRQFPTVLSRRLRGAVPAPSSLAAIPRRESRNRQSRGNIPVASTYGRAGCLLLLRRAS